MVLIDPTDSPLAGQPSFSRQPTPGQLATTAARVAQQSIRKAVAAAQREGKHFKNN
jgi:hypothetical protein